MGTSSSHSRAGRPAWRHNRPWSPRVLAVVAVGALAAIGAAPAGATPTPVGYDISFPQCNASAPHYPANPAFAIVGVNGGLAAPNPCLGPWHGQAGELSWAAGAAGLSSQPRVSYYVNAGDPGPGAAGWPGTTAHPQRCTGAWSNGCAYDYGYLRAANALHLARFIADVDRWDRAPVADPVGAPWWLDVETGPQWATASAPGGLALNVAAVAGFVDGLRAGGVRLDHIGLYSTAFQWRHITGLDTSTSRAYFSPLHPDWVPGARSLEQARSACRPAKSFSGGPVTLTQYESGGFDADYRCP